MLSSLMIFWRGVGHNVLVGVGFTIKATTLGGVKPAVWSNAYQPPIWEKISGFLLALSAGPNLETPL
jgi:hypothetical protein